MRLIRGFPAMALTVVLLSIVGFFVSQESVGLLLVCGALAVMSWYITEGPRGRSLPSWTSNVLVLAVTINVFVDFFQHRDDILGVLGRFVVWLTLIKLYERKASRDYAQLLSLSMLLMLIGAIRPGSLVFAAVLFVYAALGLYVLLLFQLYASYERAKGARLRSIPSEYRLAPSVRPIIGRGTALQFRALGSGIGIAGLVLSSFVFVIFPRGMGERVVGGLHVAPNRHVSGFADEVNLTTGTRITDSRKAVLNLRLFDKDGRPVRFDQPIRLRGAVLDTYQSGGRWVSSPGRPRRVVTTRPPEFAPLGAAAAERSSLSITQEIDILSPSDTLFSANVPISIATYEPRQFEVDPQTQTIRDAGSGRLWRYSIKTQPAPSDATLANLAGGAGPSPSSSSRMALSDPRLQPLAREVITSVGVAAQAPREADERWRWNRQAARRLTRHLQSGEFTYDTDLRDVTLATVDGRTVDPTVQFLFETKRGHCEYFASGLAALCDSIGIPVRLVAGYLAMEYDDASHQYVVRESNAHAWVEVQTGGNRWTTFDPSPPRRLQEIHGGRVSFADRLRWLFDRFEARWEVGFIAFDQHAQARFVESFDRQWSPRLGGALAAVREWAAGLNRAFYLGPAGYIWMGIVGFTLIIAVIALVKLMRRSSKIRVILRLAHFRGAEYQRLLRQLGFYLDMLKVLERAKRAKPTWQPPLAYAAHLGRDRPRASQLVEQITSVFYAARYGQQRLTRDEVRRVGSDVRELASALSVKL
ncbi:MAG: DUF3488 and transglutaminase-like domain-containing protein [Phycisphaerales bacterium]